MDKTYVFVMTHQGSDYEFLSKVLNYNPRVAALKTDIIYTRATDITFFHDLVLQARSANEYKVIFCDILLLNHNLGCNGLLDFCKFIYLVRRPDASLEELVETGEYSPRTACDHYCFRLQRLAQLAKETGGLFLTWDDLASQTGFPYLEKYLSLKMPLHSRGEHLARKSLPTVSESLVRRAERAYDRYVKKIKKHVNLMRT